ncbi:MAG: serine/threonine protein kinase [Akkermansia sp.]|nr:serine/threonine protein kinase [Akkermansia sp.]
MPDSPDKEERLAELVEEYLEAMRKGEAPPLADFAAAHPEDAAELRDLLKGMQEMESLSVTTHGAAVHAGLYPESLGGYRLLERIGAGGMGTVFRALQESLNREVAVKILSPVWNADERHREAFENESRVIAALHHTNIVEVFGAGQEGDYRYYVMSLVQGQGVNAACIRKAFPGQPFEQAVARVGLQAAQALAYAHSCGVLHRDVKPGNLLLNADGVLRVGDFGLATVLNNGESAPLVTQTHDGTLRYMPPERLMKGENSYAGDQYSLGVTLYELLSNRPAFRESEPGKLIHRICNEPLKSLRGEGELGAIINKSISFDPEDRYASMADMAADLRRYLNGEPVLARPASWARRYVMWIRRRPAVAAWSHAAALLVFLLFGSIVWGYVGESRQRQLAERNAAIADSALQQIFASMANRDSGDNTLWQPSKADAQLLQQLMPYYEEIATLADTGGDEMSDACRTLAIIALQTADYATAEQYFSRSLQLLSFGAADYIRSVNGLAASLYAQNRQAEAEVRLKELVARLDEIAEPEARLELVRSLQMLSTGSRYQRRWSPRRVRLARPARNRKGGEPLREEFRQRSEYLKQAIALINELVEQMPDDETVQMRRVELLMQSQSRPLRKLLLPENGSVPQLLDELLARYPENHLFKRAFVQQCMQPRAKADVDMLERASRYTRSLLADNPGSSEVLMLYIAARDRFSAALAAAGNAERAARENEMTLGVLSLITSRADYTPEMRERLAMLVSMHPQADAARSQQEAEISLLLESHDEKRLEEVRKRMKQMRWRRPKKRPAVSPPVK